MMYCAARFLIMTMIKGLLTLRPESDLMTTARKLEARPQTLTPDEPHHPIII